MCLTAVVVLVMYGALSTAAGSAPAVAAPSKGKQQFVAYSCERGRLGRRLEICTAKVGGGGERQISQEASPAVGAVWSPDGSKVAFVCFWTRENRNWFPARDLVDFGPAGYARNHGGEVCVVNADGTGQAQLSQTLGHAVSPAWSPDGTQIAFAVGVGPVLVGDDVAPGENGPSAGIYVVNADGTGLRQLTTGEGDDFPAWSPGGQRIAFSSNNIITVVNTDGTNRQELSTPRGSFDLGPSWSPGGDSIAFTRFTDSGKPGRETWVVRTDGTDAKRLTRGGVLDDPNLGQEFVPEWSPDGTRLAAVTVHKKGKRSWGQIAIIDPVSGRSKVVTEPTATKRAVGLLSPNWSPDSTRVLFLRASGDAAFDLGSVGTNGAHQKAVRTKSDEYEPAWQPSPDGLANRLAAVREADLAGDYDVDLVPTPGRCEGLDNCDQLETLSIDMTVTGSAQAGYSMSVAGHDTPLVEELGGYSASGELPADLTGLLCDDQIAPTNFEMHFSVDAADRAPGSARGAIRAQDLLGTYVEISPETASCYASSIGYALTGTRASL